MRLLQDPAQPKAFFGMPLDVERLAGTDEAFPVAGSNSRDEAGVSLWLGGRRWLGVAAVAGIGWRTSLTTLLVVYALTDADPVPVASFQVQTLPACPAAVQWR